MLVWVGEPSRLNGGWGWSSALLLKLLTTGGTPKSTRSCFLTRRTQSGTVFTGQTLRAVNGRQHRVSRVNRAWHRGRCCTFCCTLGWRWPGTPMDQPLCRACTSHRTETINVRLASVAGLPWRFRRRYPSLQGRCGGA